MRRHKINPARLPHRFAFMLERHQEKRRQRHQFPRDQEQHGVARQQHQHHAQHQQAVEKPDRPKRTPSLPRPQIAHAINCRKRRKQKRRQKEPGRKRIQFDEEFAERHRPGKTQLLGRAAQQHLNRRNAAQHRRDDHRAGAQPGKIPARPAQQQHRHRARKQDGHRRATTTSRNGLLLARSSPEARKLSLIRFGRRQDFIAARLLGR